MSTRDIVLIGGVAAIAVMMLNKARAQTAPAGTASAPIVNKNMQYQLWGSLLGAGWQALASTRNPDGSPAVEMNISDETRELFPFSFGTYDDLQVDLTAPSDGKDYLGGLGLGFGFGY